MEILYNVTLYYRNITLANYEYLCEDQNSKSFPTSQIFFFCRLY